MTTDDERVSRIASTLIARYNIGDDEQQVSRCYRLVRDVLQLASVPDECDLADRIFTPDEIETQAIGLDVFAETGNAAPHGLRVAAQMLRQQNAQIGALKARDGAETAERVVQFMLSWLQQYPDDVFIPGGQSRDAIAADTLRRMLPTIAKDIRAGLWRDAQARCITDVDESIDQRAFTAYPGESDRAVQLRNAYRLGAEDQSCPLHHTTDRNVPVQRG